LDTLAFISRYEAILKDRKIPKMQFYRDCDITDAAVSQWRKGKTKPAMTTISKIAEYLGVTAEYLLTGEGQKNSSLPDGREREDEVTKELREIWDEADYDERAAILEVARLMKKRRAK